MKKATHKYAALRVLFWGGAGFIITLGAWLLLVLYMLLSAQANAQEPVEVVVEWENAKMRTDGSALEEGDLLNTMIYWSESPAKLDILASPNNVIVDYPATSAMVEVPYGDWYFGATHLALCKPIEDGCTARSDLSNTVFHQVRVAPEPPNPLTLQLFVGEEGLAYTSVKLRDGQVMLPLTEVPQETACIMDEMMVTQATIDGVMTRGVVFYAVPIDSLVWPPDDATIRPTVAYARCE